MGELPKLSQPHNQRTAQRIVLVSAIAVFIIFGIRLSFSVFFAEFVNSEGWSNEASATIFSASMLTFALASTPAGILLDRFGPRLTFTSGAFLLAGGLFLSSRVTTVGQLAFAYGVVGGLGLSVIGLGPVAANISAWVPPARRGRAIGIAFAGTGLGTLFFVPLSTSLIDRFGWRGAYTALALVCLLVLAPLLAFGQQRPPQRLQPARTPSSTDRWQQLLMDPLLWVLLIVSFTALSPLRTLTVHQIAYMESVGIERSVAAQYVGLAGFLTGGTFIGWGFISDRFGRVVAFSLGALCLMGAVGILFQLQTTSATLPLVAYSILLALGEGTRSSQTTAIASDIFQHEGLGRVNGIVGAMFGLGAAFGPWLVGRLTDRTGSYTPGLIAVLVMTLISLGGFLILGYRSKRR